MRLERVENLVRVEHYAFGKQPPVGSRLPAPDAVGYVPQDKLLPVSDQYIDYDSEEPAFKAGYTQVRVNGETYIVKAEDVYTKVVPHAGITGGLAVPTPGGGWIGIKLAETGPRARSARIDHLALTRQATKKKG